MHQRYGINGQVGGEQNAVLSTFEKNHKPRRRVARRRSSEDANEYRILAFMNSNKQYQASQQLVETAVQATNSTKSEVVEHKKYDFDYVLGCIFREYEEQQRKMIIQLFYFVCGNEGRNLVAADKFTAYTFLKSRMELVTGEAVSANIIECSEDVAQYIKAFGWIADVPSPISNKRVDNVAFVINGDYGYCSYHDAISKFAQDNFIYSTCYIVDGGLPLDSKEDYYEIKRIRMAKSDPKYIPTQADLADLLIEDFPHVFANKNIKRVTYDKVCYPVALLYKVDKITGEDRNQKTVIVAPSDVVELLNDCLQRPSVETDSYICGYTGATQGRPTDTQLINTVVEKIVNPVMIGVNKYMRNKKKERERDR